MNNVVITIARGFGSGGKYIAKKLADYFLKDYPNVVSIYVEAPREACIVSITTRANVDRERAEKMIVKTDKYRAQYYEYYTWGGDWTNPMNYDLTLNSYRIGRDRCVEVIKNYIDLKFQKEPVPEDIH